MKCYAIEEQVTEAKTPGVQIVEVVTAFEDEQERDDWIRFHPRSPKPLTNDDKRVIMIEEDGRSNSVWVF